MHLAFTPHTLLSLVHRLISSKESCQVRKNLSPGRRWGVSGGVGSYLGELHVFQGNGVRISQLTANQLLMGRGGGNLKTIAEPSGVIR